MDLKMRGEDFTGEFPLWDVKVESGIVPIIKDEEENIQTASLACFLEKGTVPQLPDVGVEWTAFLTNDISFGELDAQIRQSIDKAGMTGYRPDYQIDGDRLTLKVKKGE